MGAGFEQRAWTPTKRRGPIAAELKTPGPACVDLPPLLGECLNTLILVIENFQSNEGQFIVESLLHGGSLKADTVLRVGK